MAAAKEEEPKAKEEVTKAKEEEPKAKEEETKAKEEVKTAKKEETKGKEEVKKANEEETKPKNKVFNDSVHGLINVPSVNLIFIDTPVFQRLRNITQLGAASWVYPTAVHNRFEHSIGTAHLARQMMQHLRSQYGGEKISDEDMKCVELAGLLHDIGHGPFSHVWDGRVAQDLGVSYKHERVSIDLIDWMIEKYGLMSKLEKEGLDESYVRLIKEMIYGVLPGNAEKLIGDKEFRAYMYEIISNKHCELDVDKYDYLARDGKALGTYSLQSSSDLQRLIRLTRVVQGDGGCYHIAFRDNVAMSIANVFQMRQRLHRVAYKHKNTIGIELMLSEAFVAADPVFRFKEAYTIQKGECTGVDLNRFLTWTDHLFWQIVNSSEEELKESREILERLMKRQIYRPLMRMSVDSKPSMSADESKKAVEEEIEKVNEGSEELKEKAKNELMIIYCPFDFCMKDENPMKKCVFVDKDEKVLKENSEFVSSKYLPKERFDEEIRLYSRCPPDDADASAVKKSADKESDVKEKNVKELLISSFEKFCQINKLCDGLQKPMRY